MKTIMATRSPHETSLSFSRRYFNWPRKKLVLHDHEEGEGHESSTFIDSIDRQQLLNFNSFSHFSSCETIELSPSISKKNNKNKKKQAVFSKLRSALTAFNRTTTQTTSSSSTGTKMIGTLFGYRRGHVHLAFQEDPKQIPAFFIQLATPTSVLVREMASGLVRIALECEKIKPLLSSKTEQCQSSSSNKKAKLLKEPLWRTYCNGKKCGYAMKRECGAHEMKVFKAVEPISMGAGVLPDDSGGEDSVGSGLGELMYMRAMFERVVGSKDSEAFYMLNPDCSGGPELSVYLIRV